MENHNFSWENPLLMVIFNSYVKLPEGNQVWYKNAFCRARSRMVKSQMVDSVLQSVSMISMREWMREWVGCFLFWGWKLETLWNSDDSNDMLLVSWYPEFWDEYPTFAHKLLWGYIFWLVLAKLLRAWGFSWCVLENIIMDHHGWFP